jgi:hypothetical protein
MIAKEFDTVGDDDELEKLQPLGTREVTTDRTRLKVTEAEFVFVAVNENGHPCLLGGARCLVPGFGGAGRA